MDIRVVGGAGRYYLIPIKEDPCIDVPVHHPEIGRLQVVQIRT